MSHVDVLNDQARALAEQALKELQRRKKPIIDLFPLYRYAEIPDEIEFLVRCNLPDKVIDIRFFVPVTSLRQHGADAIVREALKRINGSEEA